jgi:hypothetical protein
VPICPESFHYAAIVLAYIFWHRPHSAVERAAYEAAIRDFHRTLDVLCASFRLNELPFDEVDGYEDWYLVDDWDAVGRLRDVAVDAARRRAHDRAARQSAKGWGAIYRLVRGEALPPPLARWLEKPAAQSYEEFMETLGSSAVWQRQLVLGPAAEFCIAEGPAGIRQAL